MEADGYLSSGFGIRAALERRAQWCRPLREYARVWQPGRLKGILVAPSYGTPFLAATQVFDVRPTPRKWLSVEQIDRPDDLRVNKGSILVTRSGTVGRVMIAHGPHLRKLISDDLLRVEVANHAQWGWLYAFLRSSHAREMMLAAQYGHVIKHLETTHLDEILVPMLREDVTKPFTERTERIFAMREEAHQLITDAEDQFEAHLGHPSIPDPGGHYTTRAAELFGGRRRLEGWYHNRAAHEIARLMRASGNPLVPLQRVTERVWWMSRFKRVFGDQGAPYVSAEELFSVNPPVNKRVMLEQAENADEFFVKRGWLVMACSGQVYGLIGSVALMVEQHERAFLSHDIIRIIPKAEQIRPGYLHCALGHPVLGRLMVNRYCYGTSIPHIEPTDLADLPIVRLPESAENEIADRMERAAQLRADADELENAITEEAQTIIEDLMVGNGDKVQHLAPSGMTPRR